MLRAGEADFGAGSARCCNPGAPAVVKMIDRTLGALLAIGGLWQAWSSFTTFVFLSPMLVWAWSGAVAAVLVAALNLLRVGRPNDRPLAWVSFAGCLLWLLIVVLFAATLFDPLDVRPPYHGLITAALAGFSLRTAFGRATASTAAPPEPETSLAPETPAPETPPPETTAPETGVAKPEVREVSPS
jgi:hypothetical protein